MGHPEDTETTTCHRWPEVLGLVVGESQEASRKDSSHKEWTVTRGMDTSERQKRRKLFWPSACPEGTRADHTISLFTLLHIHSQRGLKEQFGVKERVEQSKRPSKVPFLHAGLQT